VGKKISGVKLVMMRGTGEIDDDFRVLLGHNSASGLIKGEQHIP